MRDNVKEAVMAAVCVVIGAAILLLGFFLGSRDKQPRVQVYETNWAHGVWWQYKTNEVTETNWITLWRPGAEVELDTVKSLLCIERDRVAKLTNEIYLTVKTNQSLALDLKDYREWYVDGQNWQQELLKQIRTHEEKIKELDDENRQLYKDLVKRLK